MFEKPENTPHQKAIETLIERRREIDETLSNKLDDVSPATRFAMYTEVNKRKAFEDQADLEEVAVHCLDAAEDLFEHYNISDEHETFPEFVADHAFDEDDLEAALESGDE